MQQSISLTSNRQKQDEVIANFNRLMLWLAVVIGVATLLFSIPEDGEWYELLPRLGGLCLFGTAAMLTGALLGLIFGVPKSSRRNSAPPALIAADGTQMTLPYNGNSNLEEISDWLTKMIVGIALINWKGIGDALISIRAELENSLDSRLSGLLAMGLIGAYFGLGFTLGYVWSRVFLPRLLSNAERSDFDALSRDHRALVEIESMLDGRAQPDPQIVTTLYDNASPAGRQRIYDQVINSLMQKIELGSKTDSLVPIFQGMLQIPGGQSNVFTTAEYAVALLNSDDGQKGNKLQEAKSYIERWVHAVQRNGALIGYPGHSLLCAHLALVKVLGGMKKTDPEVIDLIKLGRRDARVDAWISQQTTLN